MNLKDELFFKLNNGKRWGAQAALARKYGISTATVALWATGKTKPSRYYVEKMAEDSGLPVSEIERIFKIPAVKIKTRRVAYAKETQLVPIMGVSSASETMFILEEFNGCLKTKKESPDDFAIEVLGHCMEDPANPRDSIYQGDFIIVRPDVPIRDGDVVVARIGDESTIKRIYYDKNTDTVDLVPDNPKYKALHFHKSEVDLIGKVIKRDIDVKPRRKRADA